MIIADCPACSTRNHEGHVEHWGKRPEGVIDGEFCYCKGDCADRPNPLDAFLDRVLPTLTRGDLSIEAQAELERVVPSVWAEAQAERDRAHAKHGDKSMESWAPNDYARLAILMEEIGEVAREFNEAELREGDVDLTALRAELIQVTAMAGAWADAIGGA